MSADNGGPAFPSHGTMGEVVQEGMSLRDYFAAKAMQGFLSNNNERIYGEKALARNSYACADAMLEARK